MDFLDAVFSEVVDALAVSFLVFADGLVDLVGLVVGFNPSVALDDLVVGVAFLDAIFLAPPCD